MKNDYFLKLEGEKKHYKLWGMPIETTPGDVYMLKLDKQYKRGKKIFTTFKLVKKE